jgi:hypothetical protein
MSGSWAEGCMAATDGGAPCITQRSGEVHVLADLFREWQIPPEFCSGISERWRCRIVPAAATEEVRVDDAPTHRARVQHVRCWGAGGGGARACNDRVIALQLNHGICAHACTRTQPRACLCTPGRQEVRQHVLDGTPVLVPTEYGKRACDQVGDDALDYLTGCDVPVLECGAAIVCSMALQTPRAAVPSPSAPYTCRG